MQRTTGWKWRPTLVCTWCALGMSLSAWSTVQGQTLADVTRPVPRANRSQPAELAPADSTALAASEDAAVAPKKKSWTNWLPWQRDKQQSAAAKSDSPSLGSSSQEASSGSKPVTVNRPSSPRGRDRHFPPPQPITDPEVVASVKGAPATAPTKAPKPKKSLLQSLRKPSWLPFAQREEDVAHEPSNDVRQPASSGARPANVVEYPDVVPPKYRAGALGSTHSENRGESNATPRPAFDSMAGPAQRPARVQQQVLDADAAQGVRGSSSVQPPRDDESLPAATPSLVRSFRRPPPDPVPALPDEPTTEVVSANKPATTTTTTTKPAGTEPVDEVVTSNRGSGEAASDGAEPVMLKGVPSREANPDPPAGGLHFVPTDLAARERAKSADSATPSMQPKEKLGSLSAQKAGAAESSLAGSGAETPSSAWTAKRLATTAGAPTASSAHTPTHELTANMAPRANATKIDPAASASVPGQAAWQINPFAPPPASRMATWPDTGPRRMASPQATPPVALRPLPAGSTANLAVATAGASTGAENTDRQVIEKTPSQVQPSMTTRVSAVEPVTATRDQAVEAVAMDTSNDTDTSNEPTTPRVVTAGNTSEVAEVAEVPEAPNLPEVAEPLMESRSSSDPEGSWVDAYRQLMQRSGQAQRRPSAGSPTRRLSSDDQSAAPVRRR